MRQARKRTTAALLAVIMVFMSFGSNLTVLTAGAAGAAKTMAHLKAGNGNGNGHFNGASEAFVLSDKADITNEDLSFRFKFESETAETRFRFVTKYVDNNDWAYIAYDGLNNHWFAERPGNWPDIHGLPVLNKGDYVNVSTSYQEDGLHVTVENLTTNESGSSVITDENIVGMKDKAGKIGFGAAAYQGQLTDIYFSDVTAANEACTAFSEWNTNAESTGQIWNPAEAVEIPDSPEADPSVIAHLKANENHANGHFGGAKPEAFVLSDKDNITNEALNFQFAAGSTKAETRFRFVTKYVNDTHWAYVAYDGASGWFTEFNNGGAAGYPGLSGLPEINQYDIINVSMVYEEDGLHITVVNTTTKESGTAVATAPDFLALKDQAGKIGFGAAAYGTQYTDIYYSQVKVGETVLGAYDDFAVYELSALPAVWEIAEAYPTDPNAGGGEDPIPPAGDGRAWWTLTGGSNNGGGHAYGNAGVAAPVTLLDNDKTMADGGTLSMAMKPSNNWGVFYTYVDDSNWLYVGWDTSSHWYYQYKLNGAENYPKIPGLADPVPGEEIEISISLSNETLSVTVNGVTSRVTNQALINFAKQNAGKGRFGVKTNGRTTIQFADVMYNGTNCMEDNWVFCAERAGQTAEKTYEKQVPLTGTVKDENNAPLEGAVVRVGINSAKTNTEGTFGFDKLELGTYSVAVTKPGYVPYEGTFVVEDKNDNVLNVTLKEKAPLDLTQYDTIQSDVMKVYIGKDFPVVARYELLSDKETFFRGNENVLNTIIINGVAVTPAVTVTETTADSRTYAMHIEKDALNLDMKVKIRVAGNDLSWQVTELKKAENCPKIAAIDIPQLNLLTVDAAETESVFAGAKASTTTTAKADSYITFEDGFIPSERDGYLYGFLSNGKLSAGLYSNSEVEGDKRVIRNNGAESMSLTSAVWYYECGDINGQKRGIDYPVSELPCAKVAIAADENGDGQIDWNDGAIAFRDIMNVPYGSEAVKDLVNYRIVMNFASMAPNPYLATADNIKKVYLATDGLPQAVMLKGYGNEGHDSANSEYADIAEREGGVKDFRELIKIAHDYNTEIGIHVNAQECYPEARSYNPLMVPEHFGNGWGWLDQSHVIDKLWDLSSQARWKRFVQLYDRINGTHHLDLDWELQQYVKDSQGTVDISKEALRKEAESKPDNMDFIYLDVWYQDAWETRQIAKEINSLGWRFSTEFSAEGEYDSTWQHWSTDATYGGAGAKGYNSDIIRFLRNDQRDSQVLNYPTFGGTADNPLLGGFRLYGFEGWGGDQNFNNYIFQTFNQNLPTKFFQHYQIIKWENYEKGQSPVGNTEKQITLKNGDDIVVVTRKEEQRNDENIERIVTLNGKKVLEDVTYLLPWTDADTNEVKLYHWNLDGGTTVWELPDGWTSAVMYELSDQGRINGQAIAVENGSVTLTAKAATPYVVVKGKGVKTLKNTFGESDYVVDPGFNGYASGTPLKAENWTGDIKDTAVVVEKAATGDQRLAFNSPDDDVAVTTTIAGLTPGENYVAEIYVENNSDEKASVIVNTGSKEVSNYTLRSIVNNYVQCDMKHTGGLMTSKMQRMQVAFTAEGTTAALTLAREAGTGSTYVDDIRVVHKTVNNFQADGSFKQDFESVVQGLYPFVLGSAQGVTDPVTHLAQLNDPYTQKGYRGKVTDDVLEGNWSLKHHGRNTGIIYQTIPQNFRFEPGKVYTVTFEYQAATGAYQMVVGNGTQFTIGEYLAKTSETTPVTMTVTGAVNGQTWIGLYEDGSLSPDDNNNVGQNDISIDELVIVENTAVNEITLEKEEFYKGEVSAIVVNGDKDIAWTSVNPAVAVVDPEAMVIKGMAEGKTTITATYKDGTVKTFEITIKTGDSIEVPSDGLNSEANTEEAGGEGPVSGYASAATDGKSDTFWHSQWNGGTFAVNPTNPAILTVDLGEETDLAGFKFQQRADANPTRNGTVKQYRYEILDKDGNVIKSSTSFTIPESQQSGGAWILNEFEPVAAQYIKIYVEEGAGSFAAIAEVVPLTRKSVAGAGDVTLTGGTMDAGEKLVLKPVYGEDIFLPAGTVWTSSDPSIAVVNKNGVVTGIGNGTVTITLSDAIGNVLAACEVTVKSYAAPEKPSKPDSGEHKHDTSGAWVSDMKDHWHVCADCSEIVDKAPHIPGKDGVCTACGKVIFTPDTSANANSGAAGAQTGDSTNVWSWILLLGAAIAGIAIVYFKKKKQA